jgi:hypothetical protein
MVLPASCYLSGRERQGPLGRSLDATFGLRLTRCQSGSSIENVKSEISKYLSGIGKRGGLKGGKARMATLTPGQRKELARKAAAARWSQKTPKGTRS